MSPAESTASPTSLALLHRALLALYYPFLALLGLVTVGAVVGLLSLAPHSCWLPLLPAALLAGTLAQLVWTFVLVLRHAPGRDEMELRLPRKALSRLYDLVNEAARQTGLRPPDEVRLAADTVAHVYEDDDGREVLVLGGVAVASFAEDALEGVVAHELAHFAAGDTRLSHRAARRVLLMAALEWRLRAQALGRLNPLFWVVGLYHFVYRCVWAAHSRRQELEADRQAVRRVGREAAAAALIYTTVTEHLPWARLSDVAEACVSTGQPMSRVFREQVERARATTRSEWDAACQKAMRRRTGLFDSHPALRDRLKAMGVKPRAALELALDQSGPPASKLIANWERVEKELSERLIAPYRELYLAKMEAAQIILGGPRGR